MSGCNNKTIRIIDTFSTKDDFEAQKQIHAEDIINGLSNSPEFGYPSDILANSTVSKGIRVINLKNDLFSVGDYEWCIVHTSNVILGVITYSYFNDELQVGFDPMYQKQFEDAFAKGMDFVLINDITRLFALFSDNSQMDFWNISGDQNAYMSDAGTNTIDTTSLHYKDFDNYFITSNILQTYLST